MILDIHLGYCSVDEFFYKNRLIYMDIDYDSSVDSQE